ncbi:MAG: hypothetical protein IJ680_05600 [Paludibacteraceae bacterium]|nr:hypothetical protein [Paludibacteraceae bacterium]
MRYLIPFILTESGWIKHAVIHLHDHVVERIESFDALCYEPEDTRLMQGIVSGERTDNAPLDLTTDARTFIAAHARPVRIGQREPLTLWTPVSLAPCRLTGQTASVKLTTGDDRQSTNTIDKNIIST